MAKVKCYNCKKITPVVAPNYRCKYCNYPLNKYVEQDEEPKEDVIIEKIKQENPEDLTIHDLYRHHQHAEEENQPEPDPKGSILEKLHKEQPEADILLNKLKPDETIKSAPTGAIILKQNLNPDKTGKIVAGWLVVHTENRRPVTYELFAGDNVIGRPDGPHHVDVRVEDDEYVSRVHAYISITKDFLHRFHYELLDSGKYRNGTPSTNGTYINGIPDRLARNKSVFLRDGDTIQVGTTKLVFKSVDATFSDYSAVSSVTERDYTETVAIKR